MTFGQKVRLALGVLKPSEWVSNLVALAALAASLYSVKVSRELAQDQVGRDQAAKAMQYAVAVRFDCPYLPRFIDRAAPDLPERPPYLVVPARLLFTNGSSLPQALNGVTFSFDDTAYYPVLDARKIAGDRVEWPLNIEPGASVAFQVDVPLPVSSEQARALKNAIKIAKSAIRSWKDFEDRVLRTTSNGREDLLTALPRRIHFWVETLSPSPGFPRRIVFDDWLPARWSGR